MENKNDNVEYDMSEEYRSQKGDSISIKQIIMQQLNKCIAEGSKEMNEGGIVTRIVNGEVVNVMAPNQREIFINSVILLNTALDPHLRSTNEEVKKSHQAIMQSIKDKTIEFNTNVQKVHTEYSKKSEKVRRETAREYNQTLKDIQVSYDLLRVEQHKKLLQILNELLFNMNYFEMQGYSE